MNDKKNSDAKTVAGFGDEWTRFDQTGMAEAETQRLFDSYFSVFPWDRLPANSVGFDLGCGSGRWARLAARRVGTLHCIDPSSAIEVARKNLAGLPNCKLHQAGVDDMPLAQKSMDFGYSLGVLHHIPDTQAALTACVSKLKSGAPFLLYLYYALDNKPWWFRAAWRLSDLLRKLISSMPHGLRYVSSQILAAVIYWPLARLAWLAEKLGAGVSNFPLSAYRNCSFYVMRTDALDRFGTSLEQRFSRAQIQAMMQAAGLRDISFREATPYWCAVGFTPLAEQENR
ncbi:class I SAM-dependent methyltransferase [Polaromonas sp.]|uniref:class I SAM-dependent methyltransferase n=1 Tax=Polaromonas sp. TaxID=1869339 RepID=UPI003C96AECF